ncbi:MAG: hypothetical protein H8E86_02395, partial [Planctomycetes bacterium]|nr:hypothetical protein [Planctomycetota bacterium]
MNEMLSILSSLVAMPAGPASEGLHVTNLRLAGCIAWMPLMSVVLCGICAACQV